MRIDFKRIGAVIALVALVVLAFSGLALGEDAIARGYKTSDSTLQPGMAAALEDSLTTNQSIKAAASSDINKYVGVVTTIDDSLVTSAGKDTNVFIMDTGTVSVYVSDLNGIPNKGDYISLSPLKGIMMKADSTETDVKGTVLENFDAIKTTDKVVTIAAGESKTVKVGRIKADIKSQKLSQGNKDDGFLATFGNALVGKQVGMLQVAVAFILFFILLVIEGSIIYGSIYSSIVSIGRNPLSRNIIYKQVFRVSIFALILLIIGLAAVYLVLWL